MPDIGNGPGWSETQWQTVNKAISEEFAKASVALRFLTSYGPLANSTEAVRKEVLSLETGTDRGGVGRLIVKVADEETIKLATLTVKAELSNQQVSDESLASAVLAFRRAANVLAHNLDAIVFTGYSSPRSSEQRAEAAKSEKYQVVTNDPGDIVGFLNAAEGHKTAAAGTGDEIVARVADAVVALEDRSNPGPFACVLGQAAFVAVHTPDQSTVLPADRIRPLLDGGLLLRSGRMPSNQGIVVSLAAGSVDLVLATPPKAQFLQVNDEAKSLFRVYLRFAFRIKDPGKPPVQTFEFRPRKKPEAGPDKRKGSAAEPNGAEAQSVTSSNQA